MKLISFKTKENPDFGLAQNAGVIALGDRLPGARTLQDYIAGGDDLRKLEDKFGGCETDFAYSDLEYLPPIIAPGKIICVGLNYQGHVVETNRPELKYPTLFSRWSDSHVGHKASIVGPANSEQLDFEGELAVIIGRTARHVKASEAMSFIAGYSCYNDVSVRDWQRHTSQFLPGKNFTSSGAFGPWMIPASQIADYRELELVTRLNGRVMQQASLSELIFDIPTLLEYITAFTVLNPGDLIITGTPDGAGAFRKPPVWMKSGDKVEIEITRIGSLTNTVA